MGKQATKQSRRQPAKSKSTKVSVSAEPAAIESTTRLSAVDAAAAILADAREVLNTKQMIELMAARGLWTSPGGKTPHVTLYSAILREITTKADASRFRNAVRGKFALTYRGDAVSEGLLLEDLG